MLVRGRDKLITNLYLWYAVALLMEMRCFGNRNLYTLRFCAAGVAHIFAKQPAVSSHFIETLRCFKMKEFFAGARTAILNFKSKDIKKTTDIPYRKDVCCLF